MIRDKYLKRAFTYESKDSIAEYIVTLHNHTSYRPYEVELYAFYPSTYKDNNNMILRENFETIEEAIKRFFDICDHIKDYVKENENET